LKGNFFLSVKRVSFQLVSRLAVAKASLFFFVVRLRSFLGGPLE
jgi:hypothetical protein